MDRPLLLPKPLRLNFKQTLMVRRESLELRGDVEQDCREVEGGVPELLLAEVAGQPVGFCETLPDLNEAIRPLNGRLTSWGTVESVGARRYKRF